MNAARRRKHYLRTVFLLVLYGALLLFLFRSSGIGLVRVESGAMVPTIQRGNLLLTKSSRKVDRESLVVLESPLHGENSRFLSIGSDTWIIRFVAALPGETVVIRASDIIVFTAEDERVSFPNASPVAPDHFRGERQIVLGTDEIFLLASDDRYLDSREWGPIDRSALFGKVVFRFWPPAYIGILSSR